MNTRYKIALGVIAGAAIGAAAVQGLHAQSTPKAYIVTESDVLDAAALAEYVPKAQASARADVGTPGVVSSGKIVALIGDPPKRFGVSEWASAEKAQAYYNSAERKALTPLRDKAFKTTRQFIVERPN